MKFLNRIAIALLAACCFSLISCNKILEQEPKASITPSFFTSQAGVQGGITGVYQNLRSLWGSENYFYILQGGTDEFIAGGSATTIGASIQTYTNFVNNANVYNTFATLFQNAYQDINTLNGVLQFGQTAFTDDKVGKLYMAQAKFLRALLYFELVRNFGDVPLHTSFITIPSLSDTRAPIAEVYKLIVQDLTEASTEIQTTVSFPFTGYAATKASALFCSLKYILPEAGQPQHKLQIFKMLYPLHKPLLVLQQHTALACILRSTNLIVKPMMQIIKNVCLQLSIIQIQNMANIT